MTTTERLSDAQMRRFVATLTETVSRLTDSIKTLEFKVSASENNYISVLKKLNEVENENKDLSKKLVQQNEQIFHLENSLKQQSRISEEHTQTIQRRIMDLEGDNKQIEKRVEQTARSEGQRALETSDSIAKELQLLQTRLNSLAEEMRLSIENSKRWADQERERTNREMNDNIREALATIERDSKDLKNFVHETAEDLKQTTTLSDQECKRLDDKVKQIIKRITENESRSRSKHSQHVGEIKNTRSEIEHGFDSLQSTVSGLQKLLEGKIQLYKDDYDRQVAEMKKLIVLSDTSV
ncbi:Oidioi.mRNA.OKI2018_I69.PAR.g9865.t2.cds [Oikopleura dioica]|uniref:Oidioi.mRNA.OKI2018_I69.PAR.g9865.t2.cds n=1 Tax=Oikopleura dioica TaxID=34765 RepID=A0ABN7RMW1_OIKDI|nr:Oidioi.mRNA.OKI2018_I69.PAR.g9865.t2.cds [Oikopleura dioica]